MIRRNALLVIAGVPLAYAIVQGLLWQHDRTVVREAQHAAALRAVRDSLRASERTRALLGAQLATQQAAFEQRLADRERRTPRVREAVQHLQAAVANPPDTTRHDSTTVGLGPATVGSVRDITTVLDALAQDSADVAMCTRTLQTCQQLHTADSTEVAQLKREAALRPKPPGLLARARTAAKWVGVGVLLTIVYGAKR